MHQSDRVPRPTLDRFKRWFWRRPRAHGDTILDRRVSPLESLYDLVYAVVISQAALPLEQHLSARQTVTFAGVTSRYVTALVVSLAVMLVSAVLPVGPRTAPG